MSHRLVARTRAKLDILEIVDRLVEQNERLAKRFLVGLEEAFEFLSDWPESGAVVKHKKLKAGAIRIWQVQAKGFRKYLVIYQFQSGVVEVLRVTHASRDRANLLESF